MSDVPEYAIHTSDWRLEGYLKALAAARRDLARTSMWRLRRTAGRMRASWPIGCSIFRSRLRRSFAASDNQALGVLKAARKRGLSVPRELAVIGFDDVDIADFIGLTTIHQPLEESGRVAVDLLLSRVANPARPAQRVRLPLTLIERETT